MGSYIHEGPQTYAEGLKVHIPLCTHTCGDALECAHRGYFRLEEATDANAGDVLCVSISESAGVLVPAVL